MSIQTAIGYEDLLMRTTSKFTARECGSFTAAGPISETERSSQRRKSRTNTFCRFDQSQLTLRNVPASRCRPVVDPNAGVGGL
jgi:hypothetical protein